jgi:hypothetical protein
LVRGVVELLRVDFHQAGLHPEVAKECSALNEVALRGIRGSKPNAQVLMTARGKPAQGGAEIQRVVRSIVVAQQNVAGLVAIAFWVRRDLTRWNLRNVWADGIDG